jgi:hypothetical protein
MRGLLGGLVVAAAGLLVRSMVAVDSWRNFFGSVFLTMAIALPMLWIIALAPDDRLAVRAMAARFLPIWRTT